MTRNTMAQEKNIRATNRKKAMNYPPIPLMSPEELRDVLEHLGSPRWSWPGGWITPLGAG
jgi:hypothetical protein